MSTELQSKYIEIFEKAFLEIEETKLKDLPDINAAFLSVLASQLSLNIEDGTITCDEAKDLTEVMIKQTKRTRDAFQYFSDMRKETIV